MSLTRLLLALVLGIVALIPILQAHAVKLTAQQQASCNRYGSGIEQTIRHNWHPPHTKRWAKATVFFKVSPNGRVSNLRMVSSSGLTLVDESVLKAVKDSAPFKPFPADCKLNRAANVQFDFDYLVFKSN